MTSFHLSPNFLGPYKDREPDWGWKDAAGNSIGELTFVRTYSRVKPDGSKEKWSEVCERVINGMYSLLKDHCLAHRLQYNGNKAQASAQEAYDRMFQFKWTPPGRGLSQMGTPLVMEHKNAASLLNCAFVSTGDMERHDPGYPFAWTTEALMLGIGVGFDTLGSGKFDVHAPEQPCEVYEIPDTREGWAISVGKLINSYLKPSKPAVQFDYSVIRPYGAPIKTFGGTASGPEPLQQGHERIRKVLDGNMGIPLTTKTIVDIQNIIGTFVVAGNARRSAELALGLPTDEGFVDLKNSEVYPDRPWAFMSNNSISAEVGMDYAPFVANTATNGEPGYIWLDTARKYGRLIDVPDFRDARVAGFNPCVTADTWVHTTEGPRQVSDLIGQRFTAIVDGKPYETRSEGFWQTGTNREVFDVITDSGWTARVTDNHRIMTENRGWIEAGRLMPGDQIRLNEHRGTSWGGRGIFKEGYLVGHLWGDGTFAEADRAVWSVWGSELETASVRSALEGFAATYPHRSDWGGFSRIPSRDEWRMRMSALTSMVHSWDVRMGHKKISREIERASSDFYRGFLSAAFDTDGHVEGSREKGVSIRLSQSDLDELVVVQRMLGRFGILSKIRLTRECNSFGGGEAWRLILSGCNAKRFMEEIGFVDAVKRAKWDSLTAGMTRGFYSKAPVAVFETLEHAGYSDVYDVTVEDVHAFDANGMYVHNCVEQPLESFEMCCLVETHLNRAESKEDFLRTLKFAYLYGKTVTLLTTPWEKTNAVMLRNRRIGLSTTGVAGFVEEHSLADYRVWADQGYRRICDWDVIYSEWLGIRESIRKTTVKPSGSVSLLSGASPGVHWPPGGEYFIRAIRFGDRDNTWRLLEQAGYMVEDDVYSPNTKVVYFPLHSGVKRAESDVSIFEKIHLAAEAQKYWSDNGVSITVSFNQEHEAEAVGQVLGMYEGQLKAVSFLPMGNEVYEQQPYTRTTREDYEQRSAGLQRISLAELYNSGEDAEGEAYCTTDTCSL